MTTAPGAGHNGCPAEGMIECLAHGDPVPQEVRDHSASCPACAQRLERARAEAEFVGRARTLLEPDLGPVGAPRLPGYRFLGVVGTGGQGVVYRALQESTSRIVAVKVLTTGDGTDSGHGGPERDGSRAAARRRLRAEREVEIIARLRHPAIVSVYESRTLESGRVALVMEYVDGLPIDRWVETLPEHERLRQTLAVFAQVCAGVHHAHLNGVVHRDLKPDNLLVTPGEDRKPRAVILDFGIAKLRLGAAALVTTAAGEFAGTPAYSSPEQVAGTPQDIDALTDVYSLGVILYRLVCGRLPYDLGGSIFEAARTIGSVEPTPPRSVHPSISRDLEAVILCALHKHKPRRYQSAAALARDAQRVLAGEPVEARADSGWYLLRKAVMVNRRRLAAAGAAALLVVAAGTAVAFSLRRAASEAAAAQQQRARARNEQVRARAVTELLRDTLPDSDPQRPEINRIVGRGLSKLYHRLETGAFADDPQVDQEVRRLWGSVYTSFRGKAANQVEFAEISLRNGLVRLRQTHGGDHPEIAASMQQLAGLLLVRNRFSEAADACQQAIEMRRRLDGGAPSFELAEAHGLLARVGLTTGDRAAAVRQVDLARDVLAAAPVSGAFDRQLLGAALMRLRAGVMIDAADHAAAEPLVAESLVLLMSTVPADDPELIDTVALACRLAGAAPGLELSSRVRSVWPQTTLCEADLKLVAGPNRGDYVSVVPSGRTDALGRFVAFQELLLGKDHRALVGTLLQQAEAAVVEARMLDRARAGVRAAEILQRTGADRFAWLLCMQDASVAYLFAGNTAEAVRIGRECCQQWDSVPPPIGDGLVNANARRYLAWYCLLDGRAHEARSLAESARRLLNSVVDDRHHVVAACRAIEAQAALEMGDLPAAAALSARALDDALASSAIAPDQTSMIRYVRARVMLAQGLDPRAAHALLLRAWDDYYADTPLSSPWRRPLIDAMELAAVRAGDGEAARRWRDERARPPTAEPTRLNR